LINEVDLNVFKRVSFDVICPDNDGLQTDEHWLGDSSDVGEVVSFLDESEKSLILGISAVMTDGKVDGMFRILEESVDKARSMTEFFRT